MLPSEMQTVALTVKDQSRLVEEAGQAQDQVGRVNTRARKPLRKEKDLEDLLQVASPDTQAKVPVVEEDGETAKDPKRQEAKEDVQEVLLPSHKLVMKVLASQALEDPKPAIATVLLVAKLEPLELARSQVQKNMELPAELDLRVIMTGCRVITGGPGTSILRPCLLNQAKHHGPRHCRPERILICRGLLMFASISPSQNTRTDSLEYLIYHLFCVINLA